MKNMKRHSNSWVQVRPNDGFLDVVKAIQIAADKGQPSGFMTVVDDNLRVVGVITDSDIRQCLINGSLNEQTAEKIMTRNFLYFEEGRTLEEDVLRITKTFSTDGLLHRFPVSYVPVINSNGMLHRILNTEEVHQVFSKALSETVVIGLGFVGLTLAAALAKAEFRVLGVDIDKESIQSIGSLEPSNNEPQLLEILTRHLGHNLNVFHLEKKLPERRSDLFSRNYLIAVGTSLKLEDRKPNLEPLLSALQIIGEDIRQGDLVVVRSTVGVGTTRQIVIPKIQEISGLKAGQDFFIASAPERTIEGKAIHEIENLPQLLAGFTEECLDVSTKFFTGISPRVVVLESLEACEFAKLISNAYRDTLFNFSNEVAFLAEEFGIDVNRVIEDSNSGYSRNSIPQPSPGVGGPCLVKDSYILRDESIMGPSLIRTARKFNDYFIQHQFKRIRNSLSGREKIIVVGLAFKGSPPTNDSRESFGVAIYRYLQKYGYEVYAWDASISFESLPDCEFRSWTAADVDSHEVAIIICNNHVENLKQFRSISHNVGSRLKLVYDPWRVLAEVDSSKALFKYLTLSMGLQGAS